MRRVFRWLKTIARASWQWLREWSGDAAYERYVQRAAAARRVPRLLSPAEFYLDQVSRRYSRPNRCC